MARPKKSAKHKAPTPETPLWKGIRVKLKNLGERIKAGFKWEHLPREYQVEAVRAQLQRKDILIHAGTGSGKTACAAGPHALPEMKGMVTIMVSPLIALQEEQMSSVQFTIKPQPDL